MSARKAYISSLGTTGLLIAAALAMLIVVGALVAFDRWPSQAVAEAESVPVTGDGVGAAHGSGESRAFASTGPSVRSTAMSASRSAAVLRRAAARAGHVDATIAPAPAASVHEPIVSDLPAPDSDPSTPAPAAQQPQAAAPAAPKPPEPAITPGSLAPTAEGTLGDTATGVGDTVGGLSPDLGHTVRGTITTGTGAIHAVLTGE